MDSYDPLGISPIRTPAGASETPFRFELGQRVGGRWIVWQRFAGGFSEAYFCVDERTGTSACLRTLRPPFPQSLEAAQKFEDEARIWIGLGRHPHIVRCHMVGTFGEVPLLVLDWIGTADGQSADLRRQLGAIRFSTTELIRILRDTLFALDHWHQTYPDLAHNDLKPENILLDGAGMAKVTDFGLATLAQRLYLSQVSPAVVGTPPYIAPERWRGAVGSIRSDLFAVGCLFYELLAGRMAYPQGTQVLATADPLPAPVLPETLAPEECRAFQPLVERCLAASPEDRYATPRELLVEVERAAKQVGLHWGEPRRYVTRLSAFELANRSASYLYLRQWERALADADQGLARAPESADLYAYRGLALHGLGRLDEAYTAHRQAVALAPETAGYWSNLGRTCAALKNGTDALAAHTRATLLAPRDPMNHFNLARTAEDAGELALAEAEYGAAHNTGMQGALPLNNRANVRLDQGNVAGAVQDYFAALEADPNYAPAYYNLALLLHQQAPGDDDVVRLLDRAAKLGHPQAASLLRTDPRFFSVRYPVDDALQETLAITSEAEALQVRARFPFTATEWFLQGARELGCGVPGPGLLEAVFSDPLLRMSE